jgi:hypothetical protein
MATETVNVNATAITAAITAEAAARVAGDAASVATAASDATTKANAAQAAAIASAASDATTKANAAQSAAISAAATDATTKANAAQAASDPVGSASAAQAAAVAAASSDATTKANAAQAAAIAASAQRASNLSDLSSAATARTNLGVWNTAMKTTTETRTSTAALAVDAVLKLTMAANTKYELDMTVHMDTVAAADFKFRLSGPSSPTLVRAWMVYYAGPASGGTASPASAVRLENTYSAADITILSAAAQLGGYINLKMTIHNGANAGDFEFQWAQNTSDAGNTSVLAGSYLDWRLVA